MASATTIVLTDRERRCLTNLLVDELSYVYEEIRNRKYRTIEGAERIFNAIPEVSLLRRLNPRKYQRLRKCVLTDAADWRTLSPAVWCPAKNGT